MKKLLKIRFVKFEKALAMQILQQVGKFKDGKHVRVKGCSAFGNNCVYLRGSYSELDYSPSCIDFSTNAERDECLEKVIKWISEEQFNATPQKLEVGKACMVSLSEEIETNEWVMARLLAILPEHIKNRYITQSETNKRMFTSWTYARPVSFYIGPKIYGDVYTWEMEAKDER